MLPMSRPDQTAPLTFNVGRAALYLGVSASFLNKARCDGSGPAFLKIGSCVRYRREDLDSYLADCLRDRTGDVYRPCRSSSDDIAK